MSTPSPTTACVPIKLECLVVNDVVGAGPAVKMAPIAQPNYTFLRLDSQTIQNDVLPFTDLHYTTTNRRGVYVSWTLPRVYRMGAAGTATASNPAQRAQSGYQPTQGQPDYSAPDFRPAPTRWMIVRHLDLTTLETPTALNLIPAHAGIGSHSVEG